MSTEPETAPIIPTEKIKIQKRTPTERQLEALEKARVAKKKKSIRTEIQKEAEPFLLPSPYLMGTILLGLGGLVAYSFLKPGQNSENTQKISAVAPNAVPVVVPPPTKNVVKLSPKTEEFFTGGIKL